MDFLGRKTDKQVLANSTDQDQGSSMFALASASSKGIQQKNGCSNILVFYSKKSFVIIHIKLPKPEKMKS